MKTDEFAFFNQQLAAMLRDGIPLEGALRRLSQEMRAGALRNELQALEADLARGTPMADALAPRQLPELYKRMILVGVKSGDLPGALDELRALPARPGPETVRALCRAHGLLVEGVHGIGVFSEFVPGRALDAPGAREALDQLEAGSAADAPFRDIAARVHLLARRPAG